MVQITERFSTPTKLDFAEYGSIFKVVKDDGTQLYIQTSRDEERPHWITVGLFFEKALTDCVTNGKFMALCLELFESQQKTHLSDIIDIIARR